MKNGKLHTRLVLATTDCPEGCDSPAAILVETYAPTGLDGFGDGRSAIVALETKYHSPHGRTARAISSTTAVLTEADAYDPSWEIQELRRICIELAHWRPRSRSREDPSVYRFTPG